MIPTHWENASSVLFTENLKFSYLLNIQIFRGVYIELGEMLNMTSINISEVSNTNLELKYL